MLLFKNLCIFQFIKVLLILGLSNKKGSHPNLSVLEASIMRTSKSLDKLSSFVKDVNRTESIENGGEKSLPKLTKRLVMPKDRPVAKRIGTGMKLVSCN